MLIYGHKGIMYNDLSYLSLKILLVRDVKYNVCIPRHCFPVLEHVGLFGGYC